MKKLIALAACGVLLAACASIVKGTSQTVSINTPGVQGATCILTSPAIGSQMVVTPGVVTLEKSKEAVAVSCKKECYLEGSGVLPSNFQAMTAGNIILGGVIGLGIDAATGAMNEYASNIQVVMNPDPACKKPEPPRRRS